jgi:hypothetical protein
MGNHISNERAGLKGFHLSNGAMGVLMSVLAIAASDLAETLWEK